MNSVSLWIPSCRFALEKSASADRYVSEGLTAQENTFYTYNYRGIASTCSRTKLDAQTWQPAAWSELGEGVPGGGGAATHQRSTLMQLHLAARAIASAARFRILLSLGRRCK